MDLKQLAQALGLSTTTVSRALNGYAEVSEATRVRVVAKAAELGYQPNLAARRLALQKAEAVGIIYPPSVGELGDPRFLEVLGGLNDGLSAAGVDLLLVTTHQRDELSTYARMVHGRRIDALLVARTRVDDPRVDYLIGEGFPFIAYGRTARSAEHAWFDFDNAAGAAMAVRRLVEFGHRDIAYVHAPLDLSFARQRHDGYRAEMARLGVAADVARFVEGGLSRRSGYRAGQSLLAMPSRPTALIVDNNLAGLGVVRSLLDAGMVLGRDISVIVYDGVPDDNLLPSPIITSVDQPTPHDTGRKLAELMQSVQRGTPPASLQVLWQPALTAGQSVGPAPA
jgi:LacI family transcriptional regulator